MDGRHYYNNLYGELTRHGYQPFKNGEEVYWRMKQEDRILLLRVVQENLPGQRPADLQEEQLRLHTIADKLMIVEGAPVDTLLLLIRTKEADSGLIRQLHDYDNIWIMNRISGRLKIYENQKSHFYGMETWLEEYTCRWNEIDRKFERGRMESTFTPVNTSLVVINILVFLVLSILGDTEDPSFMARHGGLIYPLVTAHHRYYLLFTSMFIHFGIYHLGENMVMLLLMGSSVERYLGKVPYLILYLLSGLAASYTSLRFTLAPNPSTVSGGASGAIFGVMGAMLFIILENVVIKKRKSVEGMTLRSMLFIILLSAGYGFAMSDVDNAAHLGGLAAGFVLAFLLEGIKGLVGRFSMEKA
ncbi:MAG: rhomboid family intramembrane serine protease [Eubacterium sp.]|nr:rhomboid family intramembrane serine protease [Eubacterium sp.]